MVSKSVVSRNSREGEACLGYGLTTAQDQVWTMDQVVFATGGQLAGGRPDVVVRSISTDSRTLVAGDLFIALDGDNFKGEDYAVDAARRGAAGIVLRNTPKGLDGLPIVTVPDTLKALGDLAAMRRQRMPGLRVLAITGSSGKTTVKEMTALILSRQARVLKTAGNYNNLIGLPLSLLPVDSSHRFAVLEMGMNRAGEIERMTEIADPDLACITNIQPAHLQGLKSLEGVARAKAELFEGVRPEARLAVNLDDALVREAARGRFQSQITFGRHPEAAVRATHIRNLGERGVSFTVHAAGERRRIRLNCVGVHNVGNALAASALALGAGVGLEQICRGLAEFAPFDKRLQIHTLVDGLRVVNDTYNANPSSMLAALEAVQGASRAGRTVVVLGDMLELGRESRAAHRFVGENVARLKFDYLLACGKFADIVVSAAQAAGMSDDRALCLPDKGEICAILRQMRRTGELTGGDWLLVKGSRGLMMETIIADLMGGRG